MSVKPETKQQATGAFWGILVTVVAAAIIGAVVWFSDANRWDNESAERVQMEALKDLKEDQRVEKESRLRSEQRILKRDLRKVEPDEHDYKDFLMEQLSENEAAMKTMSED